MSGIKNGQEGLLVGQFATTIYWTLSVALVVLSEVLAVRVVMLRSTLVTGVLNAPLVHLLPAFLLLPLIGAAQAYLRLKKTSGPGDVLGSKLLMKNAFSRLVMLQYIPVVWVLSILLSGTRG